MDNKKIDINNIDINQLLDSLPKSDSVGKELPKEELPKETDNMSNIIPDAPVEVQNSIDNKTELDSNAVNIESDDKDLPTFNNNAATIGTIKPDKQKSPVAMIVLFSALICFILFMPQIITFVNKYLGTNFNANNGTNLSGGNEKKEEENYDDIDKYTIKDDLSIKLDKLVISKFKKSEESSKYIISFNIENTNNEIYSFEKKLYLDFFNSNNEFIERHLVEIESINANNNVNSSVELSRSAYETGVKVEAVLRSVDDYLNIKLTNNKLTCKKDNIEILFGFTNDKLTSIHEVDTYTKGQDILDYSNKLMDAKVIVDSMDKIDGVNALLTEGEDKFIVSFDVNYEYASYNNIPYKENYYDRDTLAKQVKFELDAKNFKCE